jgi:hypothetical protein
MGQMVNYFSIKTTILITLKNLKKIKDFFKKLFLDLIGKKVQKAAKKAFFYFRLRRYRGWSLGCSNWSGS